MPTKLLDLKNFFLEKAGTPNEQIYNFEKTLKIPKLLPNEYKCDAWYHLYNFKNVINTHEGLLLLINFTNKSNTPPWGVFMFEFDAFPEKQANLKLTIYSSMGTVRSPPHVWCTINLNVIDN